jgi:hypothetical protein
MPPGLLSAPCPGHRSREKIVKIRMWLLALVPLCCVAGSAVAGKMDSRTLDHRLTAAMVQDRAYTEGFNQAFPPAGWTRTVTVEDHTWEQDCQQSPYEGACEAVVSWQADVSQHEVLSFQRPIDSASDQDHLVFATMGSIYWTEFADLTVEVNSTVVYDFHQEATASWQWLIVDIDLSAYDGTTVTIDFIYAGQDGADHHVDWVQIRDAYVPPVPPAGEECATAIDLQAQGSRQFQVDLCDFADDVGPGTAGTSCTGFEAPGADAVYRVHLAAGQTIQVTEEGAHDMSLYLVRDCQDPTGTCVAGSDLCCSGVTEAISWTADIAGTYYLIVDGYSSCSLVTVSVPDLVEATGSSWGGLKRLYR